jgi:membrane-bound lytic murein transglycosylase D
MKKNFLIITTIFLSCTCAMQAQTEDDSIEIDNDTTVIVSKQTSKENEITVTDDKTGKEEIIDLPEGMTYDLDSLLNQYNSKMYLKPDSNCNMRDMNPIFSKETYIERLQRIPTTLEMPYNNVVMKFIDKYTNHLRRQVSYMLGASNFYMPIFEEALETYGLPLELKYLPVIESALNPKALSRAGAVGLWQFMITTGKRYGLTVNTLVDERCDPQKASYAAAHYLADLYKIYNDWSLVIAAYNCGPNQISKAIRRAGGAKDYWTIYPYLPKETRGYVPAFIAANYIMTYYCDHNICPMNTQLPAKSDTVMVNHNIHFEQIASVCKVDQNMISALNPQYRHEIIPGGSELSSLRLPQDVINSFVDAEDTIYKYKADSLFSNRKTVEVTENQEVETRHSYSRHYKKYSRHSSRSGRKSRKTRNRNVTVKDGDTLSEIAERHHTTVKKLKKLNHISGSSIRAGHKLKVK